MVHVLVPEQNDSDRDRRQCTRACECHDVESEKGLAGGHDR